MGAGAMSGDSCREAVWNLHYHEDPGALWELCQSLAKLPEFSEEFESAKKQHAEHTGAAVGLGVGAAFTGGALAGLCAGECAKANAVALNYLAYCIDHGLKEGVFERPDPEGDEIINHEDLNDLQLWEVVKRLMREEHLAAEYAVVKSIHDRWVTKVVSICVSAAAGGGNDDLIDLGLAAEGAPAMFETIAEIKTAINGVEDAQEVADTPFPLLRNYIKLAMERRQERL